MNPGVALTLVGALISAVFYVARMEGKTKALEARVDSCENRANEDRGEVKNSLSMIGGTVDDIKSTLNQLVGALGRRATDSRFETTTPQRNQS